MHAISLGAAAKVMFFAVLGFVVGLVGISLYDGKFFSTALSPWIGSVDGTFANACVANDVEQTKEIFFLSCGGIF